MPRMKLYLNFEQSLSEADVSNYRELIKRRGQREPLQHIVGTTSFCGLEIAVNRHVLVPRPETELLAEAGWEFLREHRTSNLEHPKSNEQRAAALERRSPTRRVDDLDETKHAAPELGAPTA